MKEKEIRIISKTVSEFDTEIVIGRKKYFIQTELSGPGQKRIVTRAFRGGQVITKRESACPESADKANDTTARLEQMRKQHREVMRNLEAEAEKMNVSDYLEEVKNLLRSKNNRSALRLLAEALKRYPDNPFLLSYFGCLDAVANKNYRHGIETCQSAIDILRERVPFGEEVLLPVFYLNLGRAHLAAGQKKEALEAFSRGLSYERGNNDLLWEIKKLGDRRKPAVPFLRRSNPINKYIGKLLHSLKE